jgi:hypothetical protein
MEVVPSELVLESHCDSGPVHTPHISVHRITHTIASNDEDSNVGGGNEDDDGGDNESDNTNRFSWSSLSETRAAFTRRPTGTHNADDDDGESDITSLLSKTSSSEQRSTQRSLSDPIIETRAIGPNAPEAAVTQDTAVVSPQEQQLPMNQQSYSEPVQQRSESVMEWATWVLALAAVLFLCGYLTATRGLGLYLFRCSSWFCLSVGLVAFSCCPLKHGGNDMDAWLSANPSKRMLVGGVLTLISVASTTRAPPYLNLLDALVAVWVTSYGCIGRNLSAVAQPAASTLLSYWFTCHQFAVAVHLIYTSRTLLGAHSFDESGDAQLALIRGLPMCSLTALRGAWLEWQAYRFQKTSGASGTSPTLMLVFSCSGFVLTTSLCNTAVGVHLQHLGNSVDSFWMISLAACQGLPLLAIAGRARLYKFLATQTRPNDVNVSWHGTAHERWGVGKVVQASIIASAFISYYTLLETTCANTDPNEGGGELVITRGSKSRFFAPLYVDAGAPLAATGTAEAELLWVENLCGGMLHCSSCPLVLDKQFNASTLRGKILLYDLTITEELFMCGLNRLGRTLGDTGLVGLGTVSTSAAQMDVPGRNRKLHRLGEFRDTKPRGGDAGIPFPHFDASQNALSQFLLKSGIGSGAKLHAVLTATAPNPYRSVFCGYWKPIATLLMLGHVGVAESSLSNFIGHVRTSGFRCDLAQLALVNELVAHFIMAILHHDPFFASHWASLPYGAYSSFMFGSIVLTCSSTLLLAAYW